MLLVVVVAVVSGVWLWCQSSQVGSTRHLSHAIISFLLAMMEISLDLSDLITRLISNQLAHGSTQETIRHMQLENHLTSIYRLHNADYSNSIKHFLCSCQSNKNHSTENDGH